VWALLVLLGVVVILVTQSAFAPKRPDFNRIIRHPLVADSQLGWRPISHHTSHSASFLTGEYGVRMNSDALAAVPQKAILAVGDSFTAGSEVGNAESFPAHLEQLLGTPVVNAASGGWGVDQMVLRAEQLAPVVHPSTVIVGILDQDILRNNFRLYGGGYKPYFVIEGGELVLRGTPVPAFAGTRGDLGFWRSLLGHSYFLDSMARQLGLMSTWIDDSRRYEKVHDDGPQVSRLLMRRLARLREQHGFNVLVVMLYGKDAVEQYRTRPEWIEPTLQGAQESGVPLLDMLPILQAEPAEALKTYYVLQRDGKTYGHMSSNGNLLVARAIAAKLRELSWPLPKRS
jgi:hypothetical protein